MVIEFLVEVLVCVYRFPVYLDLEHTIVLENNQCIQEEQLSFLDSELDIIYIANFLIQDSYIQRCRLSCTLVLAVIILWSIKVLQFHHMDKICMADTINILHWVSWSIILIMCTIPTDILVCVVRKGFDEAVIFYPEFS